MLLLAKESELLIKEILPKQYEQQIELFKDVPEKWRFANLFTSSISNYNISAPFHRDTGNIVGAVNVIICKKFNSKGGDLHIPDYNATIGQQDNSILVYPASIIFLENTFMELHQLYQLLKVVIETHLYFTH
jgi:hypothetical protein